MAKLKKEYISKFNLKKYTLANYDSWILSLRPEQPTIGSLVLTLNRYCPKLSLLTPKEGRELITLFEEIENILNFSFKPDKINYLALMMIDNQVHFHVIPRYENSVTFLDNVYTDYAWPGPPSLKDSNLKVEQKDELYSYLKNYVS